MSCGFAFSRKKAERYISDVSRIDIWALGHSLIGYCPFSGKVRTLFVHFITVQECGPKQYDKITSTIYSTCISAQSGSHRLQRLLILFVCHHQYNKYRYRAYRSNSNKSLALSFWDLSLWHYAGILLPLLLLGAPAGR